MAERWRRQKPATYGRACYDGKQDHGMTEFMELLGRIDTSCTFKLIDGGVTIFFSDGFSYRIG